MLTSFWLLVLLFPNILVLILSGSFLFFFFLYLFLLSNIVGKGNGNPLQYSCLESLMDRAVWQATVYGVARVGHDLATKLPP